MDWKAHLKQILEEKYPNTPQIGFWEEETVRVLVEEFQEVADAIFWKWEQFADVKNDDQTLVVELTPEIDASLEDISVAVIESYDEPVLIPDGIVGENYVHFLDFDDFGLGNIVQYEIQGLEKIGLDWDEKVSEIYGVPKSEGLHTCYLIYKLEHQRKNEPFWKRKFLIKVSSQNQEEWKQLPSDEADVYWKPDTAYVNITQQTHHLIGVSKRGKLHSHQGAFRDDDMAAILDKNSGWYLMAVADGKENAKFSRKGSQLACKTAISFISNQLYDDGQRLDNAIRACYYQSLNLAEVGKILYDYLCEAAFEAYHALENEATNNHTQISDYATTLLLTMAKPFPFGWAIASFWIGDGIIAAYRKKESIKLLGETEEYRFSQNQQYLSQHEHLAFYHKHLRFHITEKISAILLMSDGLALPFFNSTEKMKVLENWEAFWKELTNEVDFLHSEPNEIQVQLSNWLDFYDEKYVGDRTLLMLYDKRYI